MSKSKRHIQSLGEEIANAISHGVGSLLAIAGTAVLIVYAALYSDVWGVVSATLYGATLIILYTNSTLYHSLTNKTAKKVFRIFDHCSIFMLILGTYIPVSLSLLRGWIGWTLFGINVGCAVLGIVFNSINLEKFTKISMILYVLMGWSVLMTIWPVYKAIMASGGIVSLMFLIIGGILYTVGIVFYKSDKKYMHFIWHFFVLGGSVFHYFFVMFCCM